MQTCDVCSGRGPWLLDKSGYYMMYVCTRCKEAVHNHFEEGDKTAVQRIPYITYVWTHKLRGWERVYVACEGFLIFMLGAIVAHYMWNW